MATAGEVMTMSPLGTVHFCPEADSTCRCVRERVHARVRAHVCVGGGVCMGVVVCYVPSFTCARTSARVCMCDLDVFHGFAHEHDERWVHPKRFFHAVVHQVKCLDVFEREFFALGMVVCMWACVRIFASACVSVCV